MTILMRGKTRSPAPADDETQWIAKAIRQTAAGIEASDLRDNVDALARTVRSLSGTVRLMSWIVILMAAAIMLFGAGFWRLRTEISQLQQQPPAAPAAPPARYDTPASWTWLQIGSQS
jgi:hypothetical protein